MSTPDVVVTGLGVVSPLGHDLDSFWCGLVPRGVPMTPIDAPGSPLHGSRSYLVAAPDDATEPERGRASGFAVTAARAALADAGLTEPGATTIGLCFGTGNGDSDLQEGLRDGSRTLSQRNWFAYGGSAEVAGALGLHGPVVSIATACAAGAYAVALGAELIEDGEADVVLVGGAEAVSRPAMGAFLRLGAVDPLHCRPFDAARSGTVYGEGAAFLVLESADHAAARGRAAHAQVRGSGWSCDGHHATAPDPEGAQAVRAARDALERAGLSHTDIGAVVSHGTGTPANDRAESHSLATVLGDRVDVVPVAAIKSSLGHSGGAAGAFSCLAATLLVQTRQVPPVPTLVDTDPECRLDIVRDGPVPPACGDADPTVLINAYAFGGNNISVVISGRTQ